MHGDRTRRAEADRRRRLESQPPTPHAAPAVARTRADEALAMQSAAGNQATAAYVARTATPAQQISVQRGVFDALGKGMDMYTHIPDSDPGKPFAQELMRWRLLGMGGAFVKHGSADADWNEFMLARPEIHAAIAPVLAAIAAGQAALGPSGNEWLGGHRDFSKSITGVRLNELESMRLTLHGCHRIDITGQAHVAVEGGETIVKLWPKLTWIDVADLHPGTKTQLDDNKDIDDSEFSAAGWDYDIAITFEPTGSVFGPDASFKWIQGASGARHDAGWPPEGSAVQGGRRG